VRGRRLAALGVASALAALLAGSGCGERGEPVAPPPGGEPVPAATPAGDCARRDPLRQAYFGDLHVHTARSMDAFTGETRTTPDEAYRFAKGEEVDRPPLDEEGRGARRVRLERPLDFAAVTDHAEYFGELERWRRRSATRGARPRATSRPSSPTSGRSRRSSPRSTAT